MPPRSDVQLSIGYWLVSHRDTLRKWWAVTLLTFTLLALVWGLTFTIIFFSQSSAVDRRVAQTGSQLTQNSMVSPTSLSASLATAIMRDTTHVDVAATVTNANAEWGAQAVTAHFVVGQKDLSRQTFFVNPSQTRAVMSLNVTIASGAATETSLVIDDVAWVKAASATLPAPSFVVDSLDLAPTTVTIGGQSIATVNLKAVVTNRSVYNFRHVIVPIVVSQGGQPVAVDQITTDAWPTLTSRTITATWPYALSGQLTATVEPQVSRFDSDNVYR